ncbi:hypothetical protein B0G69_5760 [Paraburkholderia sp. RAU2J]|nr:hypothetical protein B0G69_5760 [Paraburkholderia sp. RAU2J]
MAAPFSPSRGTHEETKVLWAGRCERRFNARTKELMIGEPFCTVIAGIPVMADETSIRWRS